MFRVYEKLGFQLCALHPGQKEPVYTGYREHGLAYEHWSNCDHGAGLLHGLSYTCVIDVDNVELFSEWLEANEASFGDIDIRDLTDTGAVYYSGTPNRMKMVFQLAQPLLTLSIQFQGEHIGELRCVDKNGKSMYDVIPPSYHPNGTQYVWEYGEVPTEIRPLPEWFRSVWANEAQAEMEYAQGHGRGTYGLYLWFDQYIKDECGFTTLEYAKELGFIEEADGFKNGKWMYSGSSNVGTGSGHGVVELPLGNKLFCHHESCSISGCPISPVDLFAWKHEAVNDTAKLTRLLGDLPEWHAELARFGRDFRRPGGPHDRLIADYEIRNGLRLPIPFLEDLAHEVYARQHMKSMAMARVVVLILCTTATAGKFRHWEQNTPTSVYWIICGKTGVGKSIIQKTLVGVLGNANFRNFPKSDSGYIKDLQKDPATVHYVDEFGRKLANADKNFENVLTIMMDTYSLHDGELRPGSYSAAAMRTESQNKALEQTIVHPHPGVVQITTWETLKPCVEDCHIDSGLLSRPIPWFIDERPMKWFDGVKSGPWSLSVVNHFKQFRTMGTTVRIQEQPQAKHLRIKFAMELNNTDQEALLNLRNRRDENVIRLAGAIAAVENPANPTITVRIMEFVIAVVRRGGELFDSAVIKRNHKESPFVSVLNHVVERLGKSDVGALTATKLLNTCGPFRTFKHRGIVGAQARDMVLKEGCDMELFYVELVKKVGTNRPVKMIKLPDVKSEGEIVEY